MISRIQTKLFFTGLKLMSFWLCPREILVRRFVSFSLAILTFCLYYIVPISLTFFALPRIGSRNITTPHPKKNNPRNKVFFGGFQRKSFYFIPFITVHHFVLIFIRILYFNADFYFTTIV